jgi:ubiquinone/menaquinone biosynthesis C-methylase UbiE
MKSDEHEIGHLIMGMRAAYARGDNAMAWARANSTGAGNSLVSALVSYDLQSGHYVDWARANPNYNNKWCAQLANLIQPHVEDGDHVMEVGVGEATTLAGVMKAVNRPDLTVMGFDVSWSRIRVAREWIAENSVDACLFVGDLFRIPLADNSIDVIYTAHTLEPNGGREASAISELLRVARKAVVLVEPLYELASELAQKRMIEHGYVRCLKSTAEQLGAKVVEYGLLDICDGPHNPSGVVCLVKPDPKPRMEIEEKHWQCPLTGAPLCDQSDLFYAEQVGIAYPVMRKVPLLRAEHGVVASKILG